MVCDPCTPRSLSLTDPPPSPPPPPPLFHFQCFTFIFFTFGLINFTHFYFCLAFIPLGASREERDVCLLHVGMPGQEGCCTKIDLPGAFSCFVAIESCVACTLTWVVYWQSCKMSKPFDPLLLNIMMDALCSYHFSDLGVGNHVSSGLVDSFP